MDRELFDALGDATFLCDETGACIAANRKAMVLFGCDEPSLIAGGLTAISAEDEGYTAERAADRLAEARARGSRTFEWRSKRHDGSRFWTEVCLVAARIGGQNVVVAQVRDLTAVKETAARLDFAQQLYALVVRSLPGAVTLLYDHDLRFVLADGPEIEATGFSKDGLEGRTIFEALPAQFAKLVEPNLRAALAGRAVAIELPYEDRWYSYNYVPVFDDHGAVIYGMIVGLNVTERHLAETALKSSETRLRAITDHTAAFILVLTTDGTITYCNPSAAGSLAGAVVGKAVWPCVPANYVADLADAIHRAAGGEVVGVDFEIGPTESEHLFVAAVLAPIPHTEPPRIALTAIDVTHRKRTEADRERLILELTQRNTEMEQFTYTVSHDLKSPLVTIRGFLGMVERDVALGRPERALVDLARIGSAADKMSRLLNDLLDLSRVGRAGHHPLPIRLDEVIREAAELLAGPLTEHHVDLVIAGDLPEILADRDRMVQVLQNLIENAIKYAGDQPRPQVRVGTRPDPVDTVFFVQDDGIGIDARHADRVFDLFEKLDPRSEGTGVGLALVRRIVDHHGGHVWVESAGPRKGSTFLVRLPRVAVRDDA